MKDFYQHVLSTLKVVLKKIKPPPAPYFQGLKTVSINTFCPITRIFIVEESYYETDGRRHSSPHLFLITDNDNEIMLFSYEIPKGEDKSMFTYDSMKTVEYSELKKSEKFTPALYQEKDGVWEGGSVSQFTPVMTFRLWEKFSDTCLEVSEIMEVNGKRTFGYDDPIIYKRVED